MSRKKATSAFMQELADLLLLRSIHYSTVLSEIWEGGCLFL